MTREPSPFAFLPGMTEKLGYYIYALRDPPRSWTLAPDESRRWRFAGKRDADMEAIYVWRDVSHYLPNGAQNPIRYVNC